jgi:small subunit ribosomal protein S3
MGQKVNPVGVRIGFNKGWTSHWFAGKNFAKALQEDAALKQIISKAYHHSGIARVDIFRNRGDIVVTIHSSKPGIIIGRSGVGAQELRANLEKAIQRVRKSQEKVTLRVNIVENRSPELDATLVAETIANQLERRISVKRAIKQAIERSMEKRAKGIKIKVSGRLNGAEIARSEGSSQGSIPLQTLRSNISYALAQAKTTYGVIGVKVWIYLGDSAELPIESTPEQQHRSSSKR